jgi:hypothetical protein
MIKKSKKINCEKKVKKIKKNNNNNICYIITDHSKKENEDKVIKKNVIKNSIT